MSTDCKRNIREEIRRGPPSSFQYRSTDVLSLWTRDALDQRKSLVLQCPFCHDPNRRFPSNSPFFSHKMGQGVEASLSRNLEIKKFKCEFSAGRRALYNCSTVFGLGEIVEQNDHLGRLLHFLSINLHDSLIVS